MTRPPTRTPSPEARRIHPEGVMSELTDQEILERAYRQEADSRTGARWRRDGWSHFRIGASRDDVKRLLAEGLLELANESGSYRSFRLTEKGRGLVAMSAFDANGRRVSAASVLAAMDLIVGFDDLKQAIASALESQRRINFLLEGPPACGKSLILEAAQQVVPTAELVFGSRTSGAGLSNLLFEKRPTVLLLDEAEKMRFDVFSMLLGLMERGEVIETKYKKSRGITLDTTVLAACNSSAKMPPEFLSRFSLHAKFPSYTREQFLDVCRVCLSRVQGCPPDIAVLIGQQVYDYGLGDIRRARGIWDLMEAPTEHEVARVVAMMEKYGGSRAGVRNGRLEGI